MSVWNYDESKGMKNVSKTCTTCYYFYRFWTIKIVAGCTITIEVERGEHMEEFVYLLELWVGKYDSDIGRRILVRNKVNRVLHNLMTSQKMTKKALMCRSECWVWLEWLLYIKWKPVIRAIQFIWILRCFMYSRCILLDINELICILALVLIINCFNFRREIP